jgi:hypothetical protein
MTQLICELLLALSCERWELHDITTSAPWQPL